MRTWIRTRWLATMDRAVIEDGAVLLEDARVLAAGAAADVPPTGAETLDLGDSLLMPGLVNAHVHLELSDCTPGEKPLGGLEGWLTRMLARTRVPQAELEDRSVAAAVEGAEASLGYGVTCVADISRQCHVTRPALRDSPLRITSFGEVMAMAQRRELLEPRLVLAADQSSETLRLRTGISPHAPYSIEPRGYRRCLEVAKEKRLPLATHLAESPNEAEFLASHAGPLKALWDAWLTWDERVPYFDGGPIRLAESLGLLDYPTLLAHVNYCDDEEMAILARGKASVVYCPRTHAYFGHPPHRFREMLKAGVNVAVGTDSCASSPNLNLVDDLRLVHERYPEMDVTDVWRLATVNGARAMGMEASLGVIGTDRPADLVAFPVAGGDPLREVLEREVMPSQVWVAGAKVH